MAKKAGMEGIGGRMMSVPPGREEYPFNPIFFIVQYGKKKVIRRGSMKTLDMTVGKPSTLLLKFAFPMMLSMLLQECYNMCDSLLVGRFLGSLALTAP